MPHTLNTEAQHVDARQRDEEKAVANEKNMDLVDQIPIGRIGKQRSQTASKQIEQEQGQQGIARSQQHTAFCALTHPPRLACTNILPGIGGNRAAQRVKGTAENDDQLLSSSNSSNAHRAQGVDGGL